MDVDELKRQLQGHFSDGLVLVIGSGLSCAEGLPGMGALADRLLREVPARLLPGDEATWARLVPLIRDRGLEAALFAVEVSDALQAVLGDIVGNCVADAERVVMTEAFEGKRQLRLSRLIPHLLKTEPAIPVITTNYDRLIEVAFEDAGLGVDTMFVGTFAGSLNEREAAMSLLRDVTFPRPKQLRRIYRNHVRLAKPHGSLDWYHRSGRPVRCAFELPGLQRLIIAPGRQKFRTGYDSPFDLQRERANHAIDRASRFLVVGYGFNDDHLETHLRPAIQAGRPTVILTRDLSPTAEQVARENPNVIAIERRDVDTRSRVLSGSSNDTVELNLWDLGKFVEEVF